MWNSGAAYAAEPIVTNNNANSTAIPFLAMSHYPFQNVFYAQPGRGPYSRNTV
jgi:hypothetical protein